MSQPNRLNHAARPFSDPLRLILVATLLAALAAVSVPVPIARAATITVTTAVD
jgi:hypothetical protein